ncbi:MAG: hypothetical protein J5705_01720 [Bacteroidaceae bacterium]|nr:hypothetical protein [Bacteroidaceae bacterium]
MKKNEINDTLKVKVALEAISECETPSKLATRYKVPKDDIILWKNELTKYLGAAFKTPKKDEALTIENDGIILRAAFYSFQFFKNFSIFHLLEKGLDSINRLRRKETNKYLLSEGWAIFCFISSIVTLLIIKNLPGKCCIGFLLCLFAALRSFGIFIYQANVLLFDPIATKNKGTEYKIKSATRTILLLFINFAEYILWFSSIYYYVLICNKIDTCNINIITESFKIFANISNNDLPTLKSLLIIANIESIIGIFMNLICLARFLSLLPPVKSIDNN